MNIDSQRNEQKNSGMGLIGVLIIVVILLLIVLCFLLFYSIKLKEQKEPIDDDKDEGIEEVQPSEEEEQSFEYNLVDMAVIAQIVDRAGVETCELLDVDADGMLELCIEKVMDDGWRATQYVFETQQQAGINVLTNESAAGEAQIFVSQADGKVYLREFFSTVGTCAVNMSVVENNDWVNVIDEYWDGNSKESFDEFATRTKQIEDALQLRELSNNFDEVTNISLEQDCEKVGVELEQYWKKTDRTFTLEMMDMNGDETAERVYIIDNYMQAWMNNVNAPFSSTNGRELFVGIFPKGDVKIILFSEHSRTRVQVLVSAE